MKSIFLEPYNITLFNFIELFDIIGTNILNNLYDYELIDETKKPPINLKQKDVKHIVYHNIIYTICNETINNTKNQTVIIVPKNLNKNSEVCKYCNYLELNKLVINLLFQVQKMLPIIIFFSEKGLDFEIFCDKCFWGKGEGRHVLHTILGICQTFNNKIYTFEKIKKFTKKYELTFLSNEYFNNLKIKQQLFK